MINMIWYLIAAYYIIYNISYIWNMIWKHLYSNWLICLHRKGNPGFSQAVEYMINHISSYIMLWYYEMICVIHLIYVLWFAKYDWMIDIWIQSLASEADAQENGDILNSAESSLINMVRDALLALEVLPDNASAGKKFIFAPFSNSYRNLGSWAFSPLGNRRYLSV